MRSTNKPGVHKIALVSQSDFDADVYTTVGGRREGRGKEDGAEKMEGKGGGRDEPRSNISNEDHNQTYCLTE